MFGQANRFMFDKKIKILPRFIPVYPG